MSRSVPDNLFAENIILTCNDDPDCQLVLFGSVHIAAEKQVCRHWGMAGRTVIWLSYELIPSQIETY